jgi:hypothetical protein
MSTVKSILNNKSIGSSNNSSGGEDLHYLKLGNRNSSGGGARDLKKTGSGHSGSGG